MSAHLAPLALLPVRRAARPVVALLAEMLRTVRTRQHLSELDDRMLRDVGLTRLDALRESSKAPWE